MATTNRPAINWGQAFAEVVLILIGVGVALLADRWVDERNERDEERQYLLSLQADFEDTRASLERALAEIRVNRDLKLEFMALLGGPPEAVPEAELSRMIRESFYMQLPTVTMATYDDMVNSGNLGLLRDTRLRLRLAAFENKWRDYRTIIREGFDQWNQLHVPFLVERARVASLYATGYMGIDLPGADRPIDRSVIWSREFENVLAVSVISRQDMIYFGEDMLQMTEETLELIEDALAAQ